jgi:hypothetical protein
MTTTETDALVLAALNYAEIGWPVVPLHTPVDGVCDCPKRARCESPGKHPRTLHGLDDASCDEATIRRWWTMFPRANIGIDLARAGLVDIAPDSIEWFAEFTARGLPPTLRFASGGGEGHAHHLYARSAECEVYRDCQTGKYDVLSNGYAVMPPSLHASTRRYTWLEPAEGMPSTGAQEPEPEWTRAMLARHRRADTRTTGPADDDAPPVRLSGDALERWYGRVYETKADGTVDRSYALWALAVSLLEAGCRPRFVELLLAERDVALGWNKFGGRTDAVERYSIIVERAAQSQGPGYVRRNGHQRAPAPPSEPVEWLTAARVNALEDETIRWFAHGLVGAGLSTELDGKAKQAGKTTLVLALVYCILHGEEFLGRPTIYTPICYLTEQSGPSFKRNLSRAGLLDREDLHILFWNRVVGRKWTDIVQDARNKAKEVGAGLLIVDTLAQFSGIRGEDENKSGAAMETMEPLQAATSDGLAIVTSRHDRKSGGEVGDSGRGSSAFAGAVDIVLHLQRLTGDQTGKERQRLLDGISRFEETPDKLLVEFVPGEDGERSTFRAVGDVGTVRREGLRIEILASLPTNHEDAPEFLELRKELGVRELELRAVLRDLINEGLVEQFGRPRRYAQKVAEDTRNDW